VEHDLTHISKRDPSTGSGRVMGAPAFVEDDQMWGTSSDPNFGTSVRVPERFLHLRRLHGNGLCFSHKLPD